MTETTPKTIGKPINGFQDEYRWLSNFYPAPITVIGISYLNTEAAYQASKTLDLDVRAKFSTMSAGQSKSQGKKLTLRPDWDIAKLECMELCLRAKFGTHHDLAQNLIATGQRELIEFNTWGDSFWGVTKYGGKNILGKLLMNIREDLQNAQGNTH